MVINNDYLFFKLEIKGVGGRGFLLTISMALVVSKEGG